MTRLFIVVVLLAFLCGAPGVSKAVGGATGKAVDPLTGARLLHYSLRCHPRQRCQIECYQAGRVVVSRVHIEPEDSATLVMTDGFSDRLQPIWLEFHPRDGSVRTVLLPRDALCDMQGITVQPLAPPG